MAEKEKKGAPTALWIIWIVSIIVFFVVALGNLSGGNFTLAIVFGILFLIDIIAMAIVLFSNGKKDKGVPKTISSSSRTSYSGGTKANPQPSPKTNPDDLPENIELRKKIWKFDAFVRDNFPKLPLEEIEFSREELHELSDTAGFGNLKVETLRPIVNKMLKHLNQTFNYASIEIRHVEPGELNQAGHIESTSHRIVLNYDGHMTCNSVLALLAHEISHAYQFYEFSKYPGPEREVEEFTDFLTFYLGFGSLVQKGYDYIYFDNEHHEHKVRLGYLNDYALSFSRTTMNGRKAMKEMALEEDEEKRIIKNKAKQTSDMIPEYLNIISGTIENLSHCQTLSGDDMAEIGRTIHSFQGIQVEHVKAINERIQKESRLSELKIAQKEMNDLAKEVFDIYSLFMQMNDKYFGYNN